MKANLTMSLLPLTAFLVRAQSSNDIPLQVTVDNFVRAETDVYFATPVKQAGGLAKFFHYREPMSIDHQTVVRANRDTLYSSSVVDLDAGLVTVTLPESGKRFRSMLVINQDHYIVGDVIYDGGSYTYDRQKVGTRYV